MRILHVGFGFRPWRTGGLIEYAEDLMEAQAAAGREVGYFFSGRQYPVFGHTRLKNWNRAGVRMFEVVNSPLTHGGDRGTADPLRSLDEPRCEALFARVLSEFRPDVVHVQELAGLPSSLLEMARRAGIPTVMTLQDYHLLCPTLKLFDSTGNICLDSQVGQGCAACCACADGNPGVWRDATVRYEIGRWTERIPAPLKTFVKRQRAHLRRRRCPRAAAVAPAPAPIAAGADAYQRRREVNLERLRKVDLLIAQSRRVEEIYRLLGGAEGNIVTLNLTLSHLASLPYRAFDIPRPPVRFATLNGCYNTQKGAAILMEAMERLHAAGLGSLFELHAWGGLSKTLGPRFRQFPNFRHGGWYKVEQLDGILAGVHAGVIPSVWEEAFGFVGLEFLAKGIPVIGNARGGIVDYTREGVTGWVNRENSGAGLAAIMAGLIEHPERIAEINRRIGSRYGEIIKPMAMHMKEMERLYEYGRSRFAETRDPHAVCGQ